MEPDLKSCSDIDRQLIRRQLGSSERPDVDQVEGWFDNLSARSSRKAFRNLARHREDLESMGDVMPADT
jgi:hypothetical protein